MRILLLLALVSALSLIATATGAAPANGRAVLDLLEEDRRSGRIDRETQLLETFRYVFAPERAATRYAPASRTLLRCLTPAIVEFVANRSELSAAVVAEIDGYLEPPSSPLRATYVSPSGKFEFTYSTTGSNAVPATDVNPANGIPDRVERCAEYMDYSWQQEIDVLGFVAPVLPPDGTYDVSFQSMGAYGYTSVSGSTTFIVLHSTFNGFPSNDDPDGNQLGAAKVTAAHEFKHASQYSTSNWAEGGWVELDATWVEDVVYDATNDYYWYIAGGGSQLTSPWTRLDSGGTGSYEDCLWQHYLSEKFGNQIIVDFWEQRDSNPGQNVKGAYGTTMNAYGTNWGEAWPEFHEWCWFTGSRAQPGYGFGEAADYNRMNLRVSAVSSYPWTRGDSADRLSCHPYRFNKGTATGYPRILFDGNDAFTQFVVSVIVQLPDDSFTIVQPALDASQDFDYTVPTPFPGLSYVGVLVTNKDRNGSTEGYTLDVLEAGAPTSVVTGGPASPAPLELHAASPNPFRTSTRIAYAIPSASRAAATVYDVAGRSIRSLGAGELAGTGTLVWDGLDSRGSRVPPGVYWIRLSTGTESAGTKVTVLR